jgi:hypothetical protein
MKKMKKISLIFIALSMFFSCNHTKKADCIKLGKSSFQYTSVEEYLAKKQEQIVDSTWITFMFLNNPYNLNDNNLVSIYVNSQLVYRGMYRKHLELKGLPDEIFSKNKSLILTIEILTDKNKKRIWLHTFASKFCGPIWSDDYKIIYCGFFPTNEDVERMYYFPSNIPYIN